MQQIGGAMTTDVFTEICREVLDGRNASLGDGVQRALGRPPATLSIFVVPWRRPGPGIGPLSGVRENMIAPDIGLFG